MSIPETFRAWQFTSTKGGLEKNLQLNSTSPPIRKPAEHIVKVLAASVNPIDYKPTELPGFARFVLKKPGIPALDFVGRIVQPADGSELKPGQLVYGSAGPGGVTGGALSEYAIALKKAVAVLPEGISPVVGAAVPVCGSTAYQSLIPHIKSGNSVFINGGSGGTGSFGIQIAKAAGAYVTTTCSTPNVELCKSLGADEVIDYKTSNVLKSLVDSGRKYDHVVDNVGTSPELYYKAHHYTNKGALYVTVGGDMTLSSIWNSIALRIWPRFLGGGRRKTLMMMADVNTNDLTKLGEWLHDGQVKPVIDSELAFEDAPKAYEKLKTGRAKGKIIVKVADDA